MLRLRFALASLALVCAVVAAVLPSVDDHYGDMLTGYDVTGYKCWVGLFLMPFVRPLATPLWIALLLGNLWVLAFPFLLRFHPHPAAVVTRARWAALAALLACLLLSSLRRELGLNAIHVGYVVWAASLLLACAGAWLPWESRAAT